MIYSDQVLIFGTFQMCHIETVCITQEPIYLEQPVFLSVLSVVTFLSVYHNRACDSDKREKYLFSLT